MYVTTILGMLSVNVPNNFDMVTFKILHHSKQSTEVQ